MKKIDFNILEKDLVLLGAGHSNIEVLRNFSLKPIKGIRITLITNKLEKWVKPGFFNKKKREEKN